MGRPESREAGAGGGGGKSLRAEERKASSTPGWLLPGSMHFSFRDASLRWLLSLAPEQARFSAHTVCRLAHSGGLPSSILFPHQAAEGSMLTASTCGWPPRDNTLPFHTTTRTSPPYEESSPSTVIRHLHEQEEVTVTYSGAAGGWTWLGSHWVTNANSINISHITVMVKN